MASPTAAAEEAQLAPAKVPTGDISEHTSRRGSSASVTKKKRKIKNKKK